MPSPYAGRNEISLDTAAGRRQEADGGSARSAGRSETFPSRISAVRDHDGFRQTFATLRDIQPLKSSRGTAQEARHLGSRSSNAGKNSSHTERAGRSKGGSTPSRWI